jgi:hypothetical protein
MGLTRDQKSGKSEYRLLFWGIMPQLLQQPASQLNSPQMLVKKLRQEWLYYNKLVTIASCIDKCNRVITSPNANGYYLLDNVTKEAHVMCMATAIFTWEPPQLLNTKIHSLQRAWLSQEHLSKPTGQSHVANRSKPCCKTGQRVKAMLPTSQSHAAKLVNGSKPRSKT